MKIPSRTGVTTGVTAGLQPDERSRGRRRAVVAGLVATGLVGSSLILPGVAAAAVPAFPDNIVVFPNRDMVVLEGFDGLAARPVTIEVYEDGGNVLKGSTTGTPAAGAEFEVNHPGGVCWGEGAPANLKVTPNIDKNDRVVVKQDGAEVADTIVQDVTAGTAAGDGPNLTVQSTIGPNVNRAQLEQRIVNPDLTGTAVARRDLRALPGPLVVDRNGAYQSGLDAASGLATYVFNDPAIAETARTGGGERIMAWQEEDVDGNRQGLTIAEAGEPGGPGMGGCPAGPGDIGNPTAGSAAAIRSADKTSVQVNWTAATPIPGAAAITGYSVVALGPAGTGDQVQIGRRTGANATSTTITGLDANVATYTVEVRSLAGAKLSEPFVVTPGQSNGTGTGGGDGTPPNVTISAAAPVTFTGLGAGESVYYTLDGSPAFVADMPADNALLYKDPIAITTAGTVVNWAAFDADGNRQDGTATFGPAANQAPGAPTGVAATAGAEKVTVTWTAPTATGASAITKYIVKATPVVAEATVVERTVEAGATARSIDVTGLVGGKAYRVTVAAANAQGTGTAGASTPETVTPTVNNVPRVSIATARWKAGDFRVTGTTSAPVGTLVQVRRTSATGPVITSGNAVAGAAAGSQDYSIRARNGAAPATNPGQIWVTVTVNGVTGTTGPFTVANG
jgi:hypothetical protein